ncbi:class I SAM-dependent methyltransferase [Maribacter sp. SA7]|uniref:O-methyltransferase n=1 Tax=Maribacter zhoushanensis TaxID=3030012 RepID=UPI0023EBA2C9|nr:class I SAM-dependent methyltransferase [Maribacter zhoushanensis]MDF4203081.1 class I SAM-dependent methyltransferase [Maribacter zhoushanensis]
MITTAYNKIEVTLAELFEDAKYDQLRIMKALAKSIIGPMTPSDFKDAYLSITKKQGTDIVQLIKDNELKNIVEFGTSFGISTLYLAEGILETEGSIITTELIASKAEKAIENFKKAGVNHLIEGRIGNAIETLKRYSEPIDLLFLDGWKDLYLSLFQMLEPNFHDNTIIYVDNADMSDTQRFLSAISQNKKYHLVSKYGGKVVIIKIK